MHQTMQGTLHPVFTSRQLLLASTTKPVTPFGGLVSLIEFFNALKLGEVLGRLMPITYTSRNAIAPEQTLLAFVISIIAGARRLAHFMTNCDEDPVTLWRDDNQRACVEQRIEELKNDLAADGFCMQQFYATEAAFLSVLLAFNLLSLHQQATGPRGEKHYQRPATLRSTVFLGGAILGRRARQPVLCIAQSRGGSEKHKPMIDRVLEWRKRTSPKLPSPTPPTTPTDFKTAA